MLFSKRGNTCLGEGGTFNLLFSEKLGKGQRETEKEGKGGEGRGGEGRGGKGGRGEELLPQIHPFRIPLTFDTESCGSSIFFCVNRATIWGRGCGRSLWGSF